MTSKNVSMAVVTLKGKFPSECAASGVYRFKGELIHLNDFKRESERLGFDFKIGE